MDRGTLFMGLAVLGGLMFIACAPFLLSLAVSGPAYETTSKMTPQLRKSALIEFQTALLYPPTLRRVFPDFASLPISNYTIRGYVRANSSVSVLVLDAANYNNYMSGLPYTPLVSTVAARDENRSFTYHLDQSTVLYLVIAGSGSSNLVQANVVVYYEYYEQVMETVSVLSVTRTILLPAASVIGFVLLIFSYYNLRVLAKKAREEAERRQLYMAVPESLDWSKPS
jgi:hypothetical protein